MERQEIRLSSASHHSPERMKIAVSLFAHHHAVSAQKHGVVWSLPLRPVLEGHTPIFDSVAPGFTMNTFDVYHTGACA